MADLGRAIIVVNLLSLFAFLNPDEPLRFGVIAIVVGLTAIGLLLADILNRVSRPTYIMVGLTPRDGPEFSRLEVKTEVGKLAEDADPPEALGYQPRDDVDRTRPPRGRSG